MCIFLTFLFSFELDIFNKLVKIKGGDSSGGPSGDNKGPMGPVFSTFIHEEESGNEL